MLMRIRLPELLKARAMTAYGVAKASEGRISLSAIYRLEKAGGHARYLDADLLDALCDVLNVGPGDLLERGKPSSPHPSGKPAVRKPARR